jgi:hypothetical protein
MVEILLGGAVRELDLCDHVRQNEREEGSPWQLAEGETPLSRSQIYRYAAKAEALIQESCRTSRKRLLRKHRAQRRYLYALAVQQGDVRAAAGVLRDLAELEGLYPSKNVRVQGPAGGPIVLQIVEELVGGPAPPLLGNVIEEVVTNDHGNDADADQPPAAAEGETPPGPAGVSEE